MREVMEHTNTNFLYFVPVLKNISKSQGQLVRLCVFMHFSLFSVTTNLKLHWQYYNLCYRYAVYSKSSGRWLKMYEISYSKQSEI